MNNVLLFSLAIVFCVDVCVVSGKEESGKDVSLDRLNISEFIPVYTAEVKGLYAIGSELELARADVYCSKENPCRNGGTCYNERCSCFDGTYGSLCEKILGCSRCVNEFEVDCLYDQQTKSSYCECKNSTLHYDYDRDICIPCPCGLGWCSTETSFLSRTLKCNCISGYKGFLGYCKECDCGPGGGCELDRDGNKICNCKEGYYEREGRCYRCACGGGIQKCNVTGNEKICTCGYGYQFVLGHCEDIDECETTPNICPSFTVCRNTRGSYACDCPEGFLKIPLYKSPRNNTMSNDPDDPGYICDDINECEKKLDTCFHSSYTTCVNIPGSYKCECKPGYEPSSYKVEPHDTRCIETKKSWGPAVLVIVTTCVLLAISYIVHLYVKKRASRLN